MQLIPIAYARNGFSDKFGIPRQRVDGSHIETRIVFCEAYRMPEALRGIEGYSHLWLLWGFSANRRKEWSPTVRPPRLGGNRRVGVFATRSPIRPNPIGLTAVPLLRIEHTHDGDVLVVGGADLLDGTPIYDIKPYIAYTDAIADTKNGFVDEVDFPTLTVEGLKQHLLPPTTHHNPAKYEEWEELLRQDPRPQYQHNPDRKYHIVYNGEELTFHVEHNRLIVEKITLQELCFSSCKKTENPCEQKKN